MSEFSSMILDDLQWYYLV